ASFGPNSSGGGFSTGVFFLPGSFAISFIQTGSRPPGDTSHFLLSSEIDVQNSNTTLQTLTVDVSVIGTVPPSGLQPLSSRYGAAGFGAAGIGIAPWNVHEETFINGVSQHFADFSSQGNSPNVKLFSTADFGPGPWTLETRFVVTNGTVATGGTQ